ncbi:hypothetical protein RB195_013357 [Necator americanus]|uniref:TPM domain-containing protein n=1 Tax=Necator americanus TaxID=51031 RepID=A0ABR1DV64_NECAM
MLTFGLITLIFPGFVASFYDYTPETFPDSIEQPIACGMKEPSFLCDPSFLLNKGNITANHLQLSNALLTVREQTKCTCSPMDIGQCDDDGPRGFTISVAVVKKIVLDEVQKNRDTVRIAAQMFADTLKKRQSRGQCDDDLLIFISTDDHVTSTSLGVVTRRYVTEDVVTAIASKAESYFKKDDYTNGLRYMIDSYTTLLKGEPLDLSSGWNFPIPLWAVIVISAILLLMTIAVCAFVIYRCIIYCRGNRRAEYTMGTRM